MILTTKILIPANRLEDHVFQTFSDIASTHLSKQVYKPYILIILRLHYMYTLHQIQSLMQVTNTENVHSVYPNPFHD
jgi:hypothetical protein